MGCGCDGEGYGWLAIGNQIPLSGPHDLHDLGKGGHELRALEMQVAEQLRFFFFPSMMEKRDSDMREKKKESNFTK